MTTKRITLWTLASVGLFVVVNGVSYFIRSDGHGLPGGNDMIIRVGYPFHMFETGGFAYHQDVNIAAALGNLIVAAVVTGIAIAVFNWRSKQSN